MARFPTLFIFAGLPGSGKTTLAKRLAEQIHAAYLRIDTLEQSLRDLCHFDVGGEGYQLAYRIAGDNLELGVSVVADSCNPIILTRRAWEDVAQARGVSFMNVEIICSDVAEHRHRLESRVGSVANLAQPTWEEVVSREYDPWTTPRIAVDIAGSTPDESYSELRSLLGMNE